MSYSPTIMSTTTRIKNRLTHCFLVAFLLVVCGVLFFGWFYCFLLFCFRLFLFLKSVMGNKYRIEVILMCTFVSCESYRLLKISSLLCFVVKLCHALLFLNTCVLCSPISQWNTIVHKVLGWFDDCNWFLTLYPSYNWQLSYTLITCTPTVTDTTNIHVLFFIVREQSTDSWLSIYLELTAAVSCTSVSHFQDQECRNWCSSCSATAQLHQTVATSMMKAVWSRVHHCLKVVALHCMGGLDERRTYLKEKSQKCHEPVYPSGKASKQKGTGSIPLRLSFLFGVWFVDTVLLLCPSQLRKH